MTIHRKEEEPGKDAKGHKKTEEQAAAEQAAADAGQAHESDMASVGRPSFGAPTGEELAEFRRKQDEALKQARLGEPLAVRIVKGECDDKEEKAAKKDKPVWVKGGKPEGKAKGMERTGPGKKKYLVAARHSTCPDVGGAQRIDADDPYHAERRFLELFGGDVYAVEECDDDKDKAAPAGEASPEHEKAKHK